MTQQPEQRKVNSTIPSNFQTPNFFVDQLLHLLDPKEWIVLSFVTRHIFGWHNKVESRTATISISMIEKGFSFENGSRLYGCGLSRPTIIVALDKLAEFKILEKVGEPTTDGQRWRIPENDAQVDYDGLQKRLDDKFSKNQDRTKKGSKKSAEKRAEKKSAGKSDLPDNSKEVVNGIYQTRYVAFTDPGKSDLRNHIQDHIQAKTNTSGSVTVFLLPPTDPIGIDDPLLKKQQDLINLAKAENRLAENEPHDQQFSIPTATPQGQEPILRKALSAGLEVQNTDPITPVARPPSFPPSVAPQPPATPPNAVEASPMPQNSTKAVLAPDLPIQLDAWYVDAPGGVFGPYPSYEAVKRGADEHGGRITQGQAIQGRPTVPVGGKPGRKAKAAQPWDSFAAAIATVAFGATDQASVNAKYGRIGPIIHGDKRNGRCDGLIAYECARQGKERTAIDFSALAADVPVFWGWYQARYQGKDLKDCAKWVDHWSTWRGESRPKVEASQPDPNCPKCHGTNMITSLDSNGKTFAEPCDCKRKAVA